MPINYNPGIQDQRAQYTAQMFQNLSGDIQQFAQQQRVRQAEREAQAYQNQKNQAMLQTVSTLTDSQGNPYVTPDQMLEVHEATDPKKQGALLEGLLGTVAFKVARDKQTQQQPRLSYLPPPSNAPPGMTGRQVLSAGGGAHDVTPFTPSQVNVPPPADNPTGPAIGGVMTSQGQFQPMQNKPVPANANKIILGPNGQWIAYSPTGDPRPLATTDSQFKSLSDARSKGEQEVLNNSAQYGLTLDEVGQIVQNPTGIKYIAATDKIPATKTTPAQTIQRAYTDPATKKTTQVDVKPGEELSTTDASAIVQTYGPGAVRATGAVGKKQFNLPFPTLLAATSRYQSLPPKPVQTSQVIQEIRAQAAAAIAAGAPADAVNARMNAQLKQFGVTP